MSPRNPAYNYSSPLFHNLVARQPPLTATDAMTIDELARKRCQTLLSVDDSYSELVAFIDGLNLNRKTYYLVSSDHGYGIHTALHESTIRVVVRAGCMHKD